MTWARETVRGAVSSLVAPAVLLAAALLVAVGGSGADALSSLGQLTKGPDVPPTPVEMVSRDVPLGADVGQLDGRLVASAGARATRGSPSASPRQGGGGSAPSPAAGAGAGVGGGPSTPSSTQSPAPGPPSSSPGQAGAGQGIPPSAPTPSAPSSSPSPSAPAPRRPNPIGDVLNQTEQLGDDLLKPVKPLTDQILGGLQRGLQR